MRGFDGQGRDTELRDRRDITPPCGALPRHPLERCKLAGLLGLQVAAPADQQPQLQVQLAGGLDRPQVAPGATASITLDVYGHLFSDELDALAGRLERARGEALASLSRTPARTSDRAASRKRTWMSGYSGAGGGGRTLTPLRARRF